ncbi:MAG: NADH-quinone oxidoreductase subunit L, partial [Anaerolineales bacterium]|nr:NADH-quinone oxidoreductase subunit L [Anaerolineales bacterium]
MSESVLATLTWLIPAGPLLAFALIILVTKKSPRVSFLTAWAGIITALVLSWIVAFNIFGLYLEDLHHLEEHPVIAESTVAWLPIGDYYSSGIGAAYEEAHMEEGAAAEHSEEAGEGEHGEEAAAEESHSSLYRGPWFTMGVVVDPLNAIMLFMVPFAVFMIFVYSVGYHNYGQKVGRYLGTPNHGEQEPMFSRFFAMMSLFAGAMLTLVVADNLLLLFVGWEVMGFCSYSLIGFWYARRYENETLQKLSPRDASVKAFMTTRVADVVMLMGIVFFYRTFGTLSFSQALSPESLAAAADSLVLGTVGLGLMAVMIFTGTVGKSAQFPFHVWLPNAMEGPTPVSAVIHAAAMVSAGIFLLLRIFPLIAVGLEANPIFGIIIAGIGAFTALMAATIAVAQNDVKGVLAYSTISQLGFMVAAIGVGAYIAAAFHLITHAFFKALLFLGSGSVIHGMEHGAEHVHDHHTDPQDMRNMGGLMHKMPITFWTFLIGGMALSGFPLVTAGFWSKDEIFADAYYQATHGNGMGWVVFIVLSLAAALTAFYTTRQICMTFLGKPR